MNEEMLPIIEPENRNEEMLPIIEPENRNEEIIPQSDNNNDLYKNFSVIEEKDLLTTAYTNVAEENIGEQNTETTAVHQDVIFYFLFFDFISL
jgi:hypothetical protein